MVARQSAPGLVVGDPLREPSDVFFRRAGEVPVCKLECSFWIEMNCEAKLIPKLLRKVAGRESVHNAANKLLTLLRGEIAVFESTTHHCPRSAVPAAFSFGENELNTPVYGFATA
jgi:hypothetical protein